MKRYVIEANNPGDAADLLSAFARNGQTRDRATGARLVAACGHTGEQTPAHNEGRVPCAVCGTTEWGYGRCVICGESTDRRERCGCGQLELKCARHPGGG